MVMQVENDGRASGIRGHVGELCYSSGLLNSLQRVRRWLQKDLRILAYHRVMPIPDPDRYEFDMELISTSPELFRAQMLRLKRYFQPMRLSDVVAALDANKPISPNAVVVTFDDGYDDNYRIAFPILRELGVPATFFVSTGHIDSGKPFSYDWLVHMILLTSAPRLRLPELNLDVPLPPARAGRRELAEHVLVTMKDLSALDQCAMTARLEQEWQMSGDVAPDACRPMTWDQLREMQAAGFDIGSHGVHHRMLAKLPRDDMIREVNESKATLDRELGPGVRMMSYPVGSDRAFDEQVVQATRNAGFQLGCCYICGTNAQPADNRYALFRLPVERVMGPGWFAAMLTLPSLMSYPSQTHATTASAETEAACSP